MRHLLTLSFLISISLLFAQSNVSNFQIAPNPTCNSLLVRFTLNKPDSISLKVLNLIGQTNLQLLNKAPLTANTYNLNFSLDSLEDGKYILTLLSDKNTESQQLLKTCSTTNIEQAHNQKTPSKIYPNPTKETLKIKSIQEATATIINQLGQTVKEAQIINSTIDVKDLPQATYYIKLFDKNKNLLLNTTFVKE